MKNCHTIWLNCIKKIKLTYTYKLVNVKLHKLMLIKDLSYHFAHRTESFTETKPLVKHTIVCSFSNKLVDEVKLDQIFKSKDVVSCFPYHLFDNDSDTKNIDFNSVATPGITFQYDNSIRNKVLNYRQSLEEDCVSSDLTCNCSSNLYCNPVLGHVVTGDMSFVKDTQLRNLLNKGLNFRVPKHRDPTRALTTIQKSLKKYIADLSKKAKTCIYVFDEWYHKVIELVNKRMENISTDTTGNMRDLLNVFSKPNVSSTLTNLQKDFVFIPTDKSGCNISIVCKKYYLQSIEKELSDNFEHVNMDIEQIISKHREFYEDLNIKFDEKHNKLPMFYATAKQHKIPTKFRYISSTVKSSVKQACIVLKHIFKCIQEQTMTRCKYFDGKYKHKIRSCFIIKNNLPVRESIYRLNSLPTKSCNLSSFDFDTLYTSLPHSQIKQVLSDLVNDSFEYCGKEFIRVSYKKAYFSDCDTKKSGHSIFNKEHVIKLLNFIIDNSYIKYKGKIFRQFIGIPMGIDPAPFMANLFLHFYEFRYIKDLVENGEIAEAGVLKYTFRYLDDLLSLNDNDYFSNVIGSIYPSELKLTSTTDNILKSEFLDLDIEIIDGKIVSKVYDKRRAFPFTVINYPNLKFSNIPEKPSYGVFYSQMIRILRICNKLEHFMDELEILSLKFIDLGFSKLELGKVFKHFITKYIKEWGKFGENVPIPVCLL